MSMIFVVGNKTQLRDHGCKLLQVTTYALPSVHAKWHLGYGQPYNAKVSRDVVCLVGT